MQKILLLTLLLSPSLLAQTIYKTVEDGVASYSDTPPATGTAEVLNIDVPVASDDGLLTERLAQLRDTTDRMAKDRREREKHRAKMREMQHLVSRPEVEPAPTMATTVAHWQGRYWPAHLRPTRPNPPLHPRPPALPSPVPYHERIAGWSIMQSRNSQLMRPIVSNPR